MTEKTKKELEELFNDDLLKCEIVKNVEDEHRRASLVLWEDGSASIATVDKESGKLYVSYRDSIEEALDMWEKHIA